MLQKMEQLLPQGGARISETVQGIGLVTAFTGLVRRHYRLIGLLTLLTIFLGSVYAFTTPPSYTAKATLIIDARKILPVGKEALTQEAIADTEASVDSQVEILKSEKIALDVVKQLDLTKDPDLMGQGGSPIGKLIGSIIGSVSSWFDTAPPAPKSQSELEHAVANAFAGRLTIQRVGLSYIIEVSFRAADPNRAAEIANATANAYVADQLGAKSQVAQRAAVWLQDRIRELTEQASTAEHAVVDYKSQNNIVTVEGPAGQKLLNEQQLGELNSQLLLARSNTADAKARLDRVQEIETAGVPDATVTDSLKNDVVSKLRSQYLDLAAREADWSAKYGANHLAAVNLRDQMREIKTSIVAELQRLAESYKSDYAVAQQREGAAQAALDSAVAQSHVQGQAQISLRELESTAQTYRALHDNFVQRYMESVQQESFPISEARVITLASPPLGKSHPKTLLILAISSVGGLMLGFGLAQLRELLDGVFRTHAQVEAKLHSDCIAVVPALANAPVRLTRKAPVWHVVDSPFSRYTESIRSIKVAIDLMEAKKPSKVIGVTSTMPNEGKSTIAASLAQLMAHAGASTILVDCDLRNPSLTSLLAPKATTGLLELVSGDAVIEDAVLIDPATGLAFLPQAVKAPFAHTSEVLASGAMRSVFDKLRGRYDYVIADLSPLAPIVDVKATTQLVDCYVYVVEWGQTKVDVAQHALSGASQVYERLLGVVLNKANMRELGNYDGYGSEYYNNKYYARYGQAA
jgi:polysaccharide biosynthesis transport protein